MFRLLAMACISLVSLLSMGIAQDVEAVPEDTKFVVNLDVRAFRSTEIGSRLVEATQKLAQDELESDEDLLKKAEEVLGFNPLEEIRLLSIVGGSFEEPEESFTLVLKLGESTGNIEGLMLALPEYESTEVDGVTLHSAVLDNEKIYGAIYGGKQKTVVASTDRASVMRMANSKGDLEARKSLSWKVPEGTFAQVHLIDLPKDVEEVDQARNIAKLLEHASVIIGEYEDQLSLKLQLKVKDEKKAEQVEQLIRGAKALISLFKDEIDDGDEEAKMVLSILEELAIDRNGASVTVNVHVPQDLIIGFLREEADLPL